jgi:hypothetical protein
MNTNRTIDHAAQQQQPVTHRRPSQLNLTACGPSHTPAPYQQCALSAEHRGARTRAGRARAARAARRRRRRLLRYTVPSYYDL